ncbi:MAG: hypothetical protein LBP67_08175 [Bacteroidales bacterium]|jgi:hypothetical protein|nr:hypothetical protein [Bacteroidales bacterium]
MDINKYKYFTDNINYIYENKDIEFINKIESLEVIVKNLINEIAFESDGVLAYICLVYCYECIICLYEERNLHKDMIELGEKAVCLCEDASLLFPDEIFFKKSESRLTYILGRIFNVITETADSIKYFKKFLSIEINMPDNETTIDSYYCRKINIAAYLIHMYSVDLKLLDEAKECLEIAVDWKLKEFLHDIENISVYDEMFDQYLDYAVNYFMKNNDKESVNKILYNSALAIEKEYLKDSSGNHLILYLCALNITARYAAFLIDNDYSDIDYYVGLTLTRSMELPGNLVAEYGDQLFGLLKVVYGGVVCPFLIKNKIEFNFMNKLYNSLEYTFKLWDDYYQALVVYKTIYQMLVNVFDEHIVASKEFAAEELAQYDGRKSYGSSEFIKLHDKYHNLANQIDLKIKYIE